MSLITTCPACLTQFEITPSELAAHAGLVRCGACQTVFDANVQLLTLPEQTDAIQPEGIASANDSADPKPASAEFDPAMASTPQTQAFHQAPNHQDSTNQDSTNQDPAIEASEAEAMATAESQPVAVEPTFLVVEEATTHTAGSALAAESLPQSSAEADTRLAMPAITADEVPNLPAFLSDAPTVAKQRSRTSQWLIAVVMVIGTLAALGQAIYLYRMPLLASVPAARPWLERFCATLHCHLTWPKQIASLAIEDVDVQEHPERAGVLVFSSVLINHGRATVALPNIDLSLTDANDKPLLRRQLTPQEYLPAPMQAANGIAAAQTIEVRLLLAVNRTGIAGFHASIAY